MLDNVPEQYKTDIQTTTISSDIHNVYLHGEILGPEHYTNIIALLNSASENDVIRLNINSPGGSLDTAFQLYTEIKACDALVVGVISSDCSSAASVIFLACDQWEVGPFAQMLVHEASYGFAGKHSDIKDAVEAYQEQFYLALSHIYKYFLTEIELDDIFRGKQLYLGSQSIVERLEEHKKIISASVEEEIDDKGDNYSECRE